jgi:inhibitor of cysteine peptidase
MLKRQLPAILLAMATLSCAAPGHSVVGSEKPDIEINQNATGSTVALHPGQRLVVVLAGNPTTGYAWELLPGTESVLAQQGNPEFTPASVKLGAGGSYRFGFKAVAQGNVTLKIVNYRRFAPEAAPAATFEITVVVGKTASN